MGRTHNPQQDDGCFGCTWLGLACRGRQRGTWQVILRVTLMRHADDLGTCLSRLEAPSARASGMRCATRGVGAAEQHQRKAARTQEQARWCAHLSELLLHRACEVHGVKRRSSLFYTDRIDPFQ